MKTAYILWNPDPVILSIGSIDIRWYSLFWCLGLLVAYIIMHRLYHKQKLTDEQFEPLFIYCFFGILIGARLGHCIFYEPEYFLSHPIEMFFPIRKLSDNSWHFTGYQGLASHGGSVGLFFALWIYSRKVKINFKHLLDNMAFVTPLCACSIRIGNLMNSEIIGRPTNLPWAFIFQQVDCIPRHPGQLYEALCYAVIFMLVCIVYYTSKIKIGSGFYFSFCLFLIFTSRILIEYTKENQESFEQGMLLNMGQLLSIPFVLIGAYYMFKSYK